MKLPVNFNGCTDATNHVPVTPAEHVFSNDITKQLVIMNHSIFREASVAVTWQSKVVIIINEVGLNIDSY